VHERIVSDVVPVTYLTLKSLIDCLFLFQPLPSLLFHSPYIPVDKITEKQSVSVFLTTWHCILSTKLTKNALLQTVFLAILPIGISETLG